MEWEHSNREYGSLKKLTDRLRVLEELPFEYTRWSLLRQRETWLSPSRCNMRAWLDARQKIGRQLSRTFCSIYNLVHSDRIERSNNQIAYLKGIIIGGKIDEIIICGARSNINLWDLVVLPRGKWRLWASYYYHLEEKQRKTGTKRNIFLERYNAMAFAADEGKDQRDVPVGDIYRNMKDMHILLIRTKKDL